MYRPPVERSGSADVTPGTFLTATSICVVSLSMVTSPRGSAPSFWAQASRSPAAFHAYALPLLVAGLLVHELGMTVKYRLEGREGAPLWRERVLFYLRWVRLAALGLWIVVGLASR